MVRSMRKQQKRERTLGQAISLALGAVVAVGLVLFLALMLFPGSAVHQFFLLAHYNASNTLPTDPLFQQLMEKIDEQEALLGMPLSLLCGGLTLGWFAPSYATRRRVLISAAAIALGLMTLFLLFLWPTAILQQTALNTQAGGAQVYITAPLDVIRNQVFWGLVWTLVCVLGALLGRRLRIQSAKRAAPASALKAAGR